MKSGYLGKLITRPTIWELLYSNPMNYVCTLDLNVVNRTMYDASIDLVITSIDVNILPPHEADFIFANEGLSKNKNFNKKGIILGQGEKLYIRSSVPNCCASAYGFIDELIVEDTTTPLVMVSCYGGNTASASDTAEFFVYSKNISNGTPFTFSISDISLTRISMLTINSDSVTKSLNSQFQLVDGSSRIKITLVENNVTWDGEKITLNIPEFKYKFTKKLNCLYQYVP